MKKIQLTQGRFALVDDTDFGWLNKWKWCAIKGGGKFYATRSILHLSNKYVVVYMHRQILGLQKGDKKQTDHIDGDGLNNQRKNLRLCTHQQNQHNRKLQITKMSRFKGVYQNKRGKKWRAEICFNRKRRYLGSFNGESEAAKAYDDAARKYFGEFARLNLI